MSVSASYEPEITALLVAPDRNLAQEFLATVPQTRAFQILADLKSYPTQANLEMRLRQLKPLVLLLDMASDTAAALELVKTTSALAPPVHVIVLHSRSDSQAILQSLRAGAIEFLSAPFELASQREAIARLRRLVSPEVPRKSQDGVAVAFASSKPGSGASTIATQTAFSLRRLTGKKVLLVDCDLTGGTIGFYLKLSHPYSLVDAMKNVDRLDAGMLNSLTVNYGGVDILPAPAAPCAEPIPADRLRALIEQARQLYDWVVLDLPTVFQRTTLAAISECDCAFFVTTSELPSLHLTRKAVMLVDQLGFPKDRFHILVNRVERHDEIGVEDMEKLFAAKVHTRLPNDYFSLHRVVTLGQPLGAEGDLGKAIEGVAGRLNTMLGEGAKKGAGGLRDLRPALSQA
jgi:pilus assembly protein CpaE